MADVFHAQFGTNSIPIFAFQLTYREQQRFLGLQLWPRLWLIDVVNQSQEGFYNAFTLSPEQSQRLKKS